MQGLNAQCCQVNVSAIMNNKGPQGFISKRKTIQMPYHNVQHFTIDIFPFHEFLIAH